MSAPGAARRGMRRYAIAYAVLGIGVACLIALALAIGSGKSPTPGVGGVYTVAGSTCLSKSFHIVQSGQFVQLTGEPKGHASLRMSRSDSVIRGGVTCADGHSAQLVLRIGGTSAKRSLTGTMDGQPVTATYEEPFVANAAKPGAPPSPEQLFGRLMIAIAIVIIVARLIGSAIGRIGQPAVMGEVLAGILLGPTLLGAVAPGLEKDIFPPEVIPLITAGADIGLAFYLFLVGLELDPRMLRGRVTQAALISNASVAVPLTFGFLVSIPIYKLLGPPKSFAPFALFVGVSMSITAFPVLARILIEKRMLRAPIGALALSAAAIDDVTAWSLLALATAVATGGSSLHVVRIIALTAVFCLFMAVVGRRLLARVSTAYDESGTIPVTWITAIFVGVLLSGWTAQRIGVATIFGAFVMGLIMPRRAELTQDVTRRMEDFVGTVLLPLFFVVTGLKTRVGLLDRPVLWLIAAVLLLVAIVGKWLGALTAARIGGYSLRDSAVLAALMNARGLTELIVLNIGLEAGIITPTLYAMLVLMALVTTFMTGPSLRLLDPTGSLAAPPEDALRATRAAGAPEVPDRSILVAPRDPRNIPALLALAEPIARSKPPRQIILARLFSPPSAGLGLAAADRELATETAELARWRSRLDADGVPSRTVAFTSTRPGDDLVRMAREQEVDLLLLDGRRPLLGGLVPRGEVGEALANAACDVAVLIEREGSAPALGPDAPVIVPFGALEHDWAALELGAWIASTAKAPLRLLGAGGTGEGRDASRTLASASLVIQQLAGIAAEPVLVEPGSDQLMAAVRGAGLVVVGLPDDWRKVGFGELRAAISGVAPTLFVRKGQRAGALATRDQQMTQFSWSQVGPAGARSNVPGQT